MNNVVNLSTPNELLNHQILGITGEHLPEEECLNLIESHFSGWDVDQIIPEDCEDIRGICEFVDSQIGKMSGKQICTARDFYSRAFVRVLSSSDLNSDWEESCVSSLFGLATKEVKEALGQLVLNRLKNEGCRFKFLDVINGKASDKDLKAIVEHIDHYRQHEFIPYIAHFVGNGKLAEICSRAGTIQWTRFSLDLVRDRDSIIACLKYLKGEHERGLRNDLLFMLSERWSEKTDENKRAILEIALDTKDDWLIHDVITYLRMEDDRSLFGAVIHGKVADAEKALGDRESSLKERCDYDFTPLHYASLRNDAPMVEFLINAKADMSAVGGPIVDINKGLEKSNPLLLAAWYAHEPALNVFIENLPHSPRELEQILDRRNGFGFSARYCAFANNHKQLMDRFPPSELDKEIYRAKLLAHANGIWGNLEISYPIGVPLEGGLTYGMYLEIAKSIHEGIPDQDLDPEIKNQLVSAMEAASHPRTPEEILKRINEGKLTIIPSGPHQHYTAIVIYKNRVLNIDGAPRVPVIQLSAGSPITLEHIQKFLAKQTQVRPPLHDEYFSRKNADEIECMPKKQSVGNCSYYAPKHAFRQGLALLLGDAEKARNIAKNWSTYFRMKQLKNYLIAHLPENNPMYPPDRDLIDEAFEKINKRIGRSSEEKQKEFSEEIDELYSMKELLFSCTN